MDNIHVPHLTESLRYRIMFVAFCDALDSNLGFWTTSSTVSSSRLTLESESEDPVTQKGMKLHINTFTTSLTA